MWVDPTSQTASSSAPQQADIRDVQPPLEGFVQPATCEGRLHVASVVSAMQLEAAAVASSASSKGGGLLSRWFGRAQEPDDTRDREGAARFSEAARQLREHPAESLEELNLVRLVAGLPPIAPDELRSDRFAPAARIVTEISNLREACALFHERDSDVAGIVLSSSPEFRFSYDEEAMILAAKSGVAFGFTVSGNPFEESFHSALRERLMSAHHLRVLDTHRGSGGTSEDQTEQALRMYRSLSEAARLTVAANHPEVFALLDQQDRHPALAQDDRFRVALEVRTTPDVLAVDGGGSIPHVDLGYGIRFGALLYGSGSEEPLGTRFVNDAEISTFRAEADGFKQKWSQSFRPLPREHLAAANANDQVQERMLAELFGPAIHNAIVTSTQGEATLFRQANGSPPDPRAPIHYGPVLPRTVGGADPRLGVSRVSVFIAMDSKVD